MGFRPTTQVDIHQLRLFIMVIEHRFNSIGTVHLYEVGSAVPLVTVSRCIQGVTKRKEYGYGSREEVTCEK